MDETVLGSSEVRRFQERVRELERLLGRKTMEVVILKEVFTNRCGTVQAPHAVEWLRRRQSLHRHRDTRLRRCCRPGAMLHPAAEPGIPKPSSKRFKRDYARVHPLPDAATVLRQIAKWFDDYNESYSGPGMISPREFIRAQVAK